METMKLIYRNSHFELVPAEKLPEYGNRIVQIGHATRGLHASVSYLCEVQDEPEEIVKLPGLMTAKGIEKARKDAMNLFVVDLDDLLKED